MRLRPVKEADELLNEHVDTNAYVDQGKEYAPDQLPEVPPNPGDDEGDNGAEA